MGRLASLQLILLIVDVLERLHTLLHDLVDIVYVASDVFSHVRVQ